MVGQDGWTKEERAEWWALVRKEGKISERKRALERIALERRADRDGRTPEEQKRWEDLSNDPTLACKF